MFTVSVGTLALQAVWAVVLQVGTEGGRTETHRASLDSSHLPDGEAIVRMRKDFSKESSELVVVFYMCLLTNYS